LTDSPLIELRNVLTSGGLRQVQIAMPGTRPSNAGAQSLSGRDYPIPMMLEDFGSPLRRLLARK
jgi:hypothetical protein